MNYKNLEEVLAISNEIAKLEHNIELCKKAKAEGEFFLSLISNRSSNANKFKKLLLSDGTLDREFYESVLTFMQEKLESNIDTFKKHLKEL